LNVTACSSSFKALKSNRTVTTRYLGSCRIDSSGIAGIANALELKKAVKHELACND